MNWAYIAGFTDGEGYVMNRYYTTREFSKSNEKWYVTTRLRRTIVLTQSQKQHDVLYKIAEFLNTELDTSIKIYNRGDGNSQLVIKRQSDVLRVAKNIIEYSIVKRDKLAELIATYENPELLEANQ